MKFYLRQELKQVRASLADKTVGRFCNWSNTSASKHDRQTFTTKFQQCAIIKSNTLYLLGLLGYRLSDNIYRVNKECPSHVSTMKIVPHS